MSQKQTRQTAKVQQVKRIPWWVSVIGAIIIYSTLKYILPEFTPTNQTLGELFQLAPAAAPVLTIPFLLLAAKQLYDNDLPAGEVPEKKTDEA